MPYMNKEEFSRSIMSLKVAARHFGSQRALAKHLKVTTSTVSQWFHGVRPLPIQRALQLEKLLNGALTAEDFRPDIYKKLGLNCW